MAEHKCCCGASAADADKCRTILILGVFIGLSNAPLLRLEGAEKWSFKCLAGRKRLASA